MATKRSRSASVASGLDRSDCPVACALDLLGDRWTLVVVRDLLMGGKKRYGDFQSSPESIPTNILAERLKRLELSGLVVKRPYQQHPVRYEYALTKAGSDLKAVLISLAKWGNQHIPGTRTDWPGR